MNLQSPKFWKGPQIMSEIQTEWNKKIEDDHRRV